MEIQFAKQNIENIRVSAFTPSDFGEYLHHEGPITCKYPGCKTCDYEFACLMSHIKAIQKGLESGDDYFIILEDDICLPFEIDYESIIKDMPDDTEILQLLILFGPTVKTLHQIYERQQVKFVRWKYLLPSAGMYMISREGGQKLIDMFYKNGKYSFMTSPYQIVADVLLYESVKTYATTSPYAYPQSTLGSTIHPDHISSHEKAVIDIKEVMEKEIPYIKKRVC